MHLSRRRNGFTLIELLVVIAIIAILAVVVVLTLNPAELLRQSRDANRISDMATLTSALGIYSDDQSGAVTFNMGSSSVVYSSISDPSATTTAGTNCSTLGFLTLPATYSYHCPAQSASRNVNGLGWVPVNLQNITSGSPIGTMPVDPVNQSSSHLYYTYAVNGSQYEATAVMESVKYGVGGSGDVISNDGGSLASVYEKGSKFNLEPMDYGDPTLIGWWPLSEGTSTTAYDDSGNNASGTWMGSQVGNSGYYTTSARVAPYAGAFDGASTYVSVPTPPSMGTTFTIVAWVKTTATGFQDILTLNRTVHNNEFVFLMNSNGTITFWDYSGGYGFSNANTSVGTVNNGNWNMVVFTRSGTAGRYYINGVADAAPTAAQSNSYTYANLNISHVGDSDGTWNGSLSDIRIYNRALSAVQIAAMYNGGK